MYRDGRCRYLKIVDEVKPSLSQAKQLKKLSQDGSLTLNKIESILSELKKPPRNEANDSVRFRKYFPSDYSQKQMDAVIIELLTDWKARAAI